MVERGNTSTQSGSIFQPAMLDYRSVYYVFRINDLFFAMSGFFNQCVKYLKLLRITSAFTFLEVIQCFKVALYIREPQAIWTKEKYQLDRTQPTTPSILQICFLLVFVFRICLPHPHQQWRVLAPNARNLDLSTRQPKNNVKRTVEKLG